MEFIIGRTPLERFAEVSLSNNSKRDQVDMSEAKYLSLIVSAFVLYFPKKIPFIICYLAKNRNILSCLLFEFIML